MSNQVSSVTHHVDLSFLAEMFSSLRTVTVWLGWPLATDECEVAHRLTGSSGPPQNWSNHHSSLGNLQGDDDWTTGQRPIVRGLAFPQHPRFYGYIQDGTGKLHSTHPCGTLKRTLA